MRMLLLSSESSRLERGVLGGSLPVRTRRKFSTVTYNVEIKLNLKIYVQLTGVDKLQVK